MSNYELTEEDFEDMDEVEILEYQLQKGFITQEDYDIRVAEKMFAGND